MGNPLSPTIGDLVMETILDTVMTRTTFPVPVLNKYVDDLLLIIPGRKSLKFYKYSSNTKQDSSSR